MSEPNLRSVVQELLGTKREVLTIGVKLGARPGWRELSAVTAAHELDASFDGILWQPRSFTRDDLSRIRGKLRAGGALLLFVEVARGPLSLLRSLVERPKGPAPALFETCEALLSSGLLEPTVYGLGKRGFVVAARLPPQRCELDEVFEQPAH